MWSSTKQCGNAVAGTRHRPGVADARQLVAESGAVVDGRDVERLLERHPADVHQAAEHVGREAGAFLVGEERRPPRRARS